MGELLLCILAINAEAKSAQEDFRAVNGAQTREPAGEVRLVGTPGDEAIWLKNKTLTAERISVEVQGASLEGRSFLGIAFPRTNDQTFEAVYLRPFNFNSSNPARCAHSVQYVVTPAYPRQSLRQNHPGKYKAALPPTVAAGSWVLTLTIDAPESADRFRNMGTET
jgi:hypothetical protein